MNELNQLRQQLEKEVLYHKRKSLERKIAALEKASKKIEPPQLPLI